MDRRKSEGQTALITGSSGGIGLELARRFAVDGYDLVLVARSADLLEQVATDLSREFGIKVSPIAHDLGRPAAGRDLVEMLGKRALAIDVLVNNAGYGAAGAFDASDCDVQLGMIDLNIRALVELTHMLWPNMLRQKRGGVLNVASIAAFQPGPFMAVYCASKAFVLSFSEALWEEARGTGVHVACLCPGVTKTAFHRRAGTAGLPLLRGRQMPAAQVADLGYRAFQANRRVRVTGFWNGLLTYATAVAPRTMVLGTGRRLLGA